MNSFVLVPVTPAAVASVRTTRRDSFGNDPVAEVRADAPNAYPCRVCLRDAEVGESLLLFSYSPFAGPAPYRTVGPIYVHTDWCVPPTERHTVPDQLHRRLLSVRAFDATGWMRTCEVMEGHALAAYVEQVFLDERLERVHVHIARTGCFACELRRSAS